ncbi:helix-turn-helix domain-containing protein [Methylobacterium radiotolerans]|uniref:helix-turn-helix domain-containing protein n=1 Tax=Methylobacterium radiotolerans TaxID=31998 RepID=UPI0009761376|nr:helix-turn-helix domain-containing protein [Methylobacterium radiotolerans]ONF49421.1 AraC family transcriptional regulator [Methylobacterium radiotolerans]
MQRIFSSDDLHPRFRFQRWRDAMCAYYPGVKLEPLSNKPFKSYLEQAQYGPLMLGRMFHGSMRVVSAQASSRGRGVEDGLGVIFNLEGRSWLQHDDREAVCQTGDFTVVDQRPATYVTEESTHLLVNLPRDRLERMLGPSRLFTAIPIGQGSASASLTMSFFRQLIEVGGTLGPNAAERMASIGVDLIMASLAERLAQEAPRPVHGTLVVQRAKAYVEANLGDPSLDPPRLAAAMGVSLRRLQELFHERGRHISDYIWERRLAAAAKRLTDLSCAHLSIGMLAYGCGFSSQAHFARRFKERYDTSPREYRQGMEPVASFHKRSSKSVD